MIPSEARMDGHDDQSPTRCLNNREEEKSFRREHRNATQYIILEHIVPIIPVDVVLPDAR